MWHGYRTTDLLLGMVPNLWEIFANSMSMGKTSQIKTRSQLSGAVGSLLNALLRKLPAVFYIGHFCHVFFSRRNIVYRVYQFIRNRALSGGRFRYNCNYIIICFTLTQEMQMILAVPHLFGLVTCTSVTLETCKTLSSPWGEFPWANGKDCLGSSVFYLQN